ncbi:hypothetical protein CAEBREN_08751 [Caenorhabditis brenneri]|uniref:Uncharacterized protein n=1 Tax=Caenorhabditis brenneri TaxID=135651 RepID=G0P515_CAEBE|nr:hypothetical protein CAEBREN_08751 [Caenorhabditis brenneri]
MDQVHNSEPDDGQIPQLLNGVATPRMVLPPAQQEALQPKKVKKPIVTHERFIKMQRELSGQPGNQKQRQQMPMRPHPMLQQQSPQLHQQMQQNAMPSPQMAQQRPPSCQQPQQRQKTPIPLPRILQDPAIQLELHQLLAEEREMARQEERAQEHQRLQEQQKLQEQQRVLLEQQKIQDQQRQLQQRRNLNQVINRLHEAQARAQSAQMPQSINMSLIFSFFLNGMPSMQLTQAQMPQLVQQQQQQQHREPPQPQNGQPPQQRAQQEVVPHQNGVQSLQTMHQEKEQMLHQQQQHRVAGPQGAQIPSQPHQNGLPPLLLMQQQMLQQLHQQQQHHRVADPQGAQMPPQPQQNGMPPLQRVLQMIHQEMEVQQMLKQQHRQQLEQMHQQQQQQEQRIFGLGRPPQGAQSLQRLDAAGEDDASARAASPGTSPASTSTSLSRSTPSSDNLLVVSDPSDGNTSLTGQQEKMAGKPVKKGFSIESLLGRVEGESSPKRMKLGGSNLMEESRVAAEDLSMPVEDTIQSDELAPEDASIAPRVENVRTEEDSAPALELGQSQISNVQVVEEDPVAPQYNQDAAARVS